VCVYQRRRKKKCAFPSRSRRRSMGKKRLQRERKRCFSSLFCLVSLLFGNDLSILRDELTANLSLSRALDRVSSLSFFSSRERLEKGKEVRRESVCFCPFGGGARKKNFTTHDEAAKTERRRREQRWGREAKDSKQRTCLLAVFAKKKKKKKIVI